ncbi:hypothetical protein [Spirosoma sp. KUDC1026]|uniref:hypothetical protein n=1 Tax=Spirosoma sp. KUDC1026 TaxID=2745947 RepID=UPI00159BC891|nr:hypothetical protein [Spirosoma sp. KUDC1026]QKZ14884.1 hypothetical protein HU175_20540 [Spirosoma sp. KUDC1026]
MSLPTKLLAGIAFVCFSLLLTPTSHAQTLAKNGAWLEKHFAKLVTDKDNAATFTFKGCQMNMAVADKDKDGSVNINMGWLLSDVRKVSYKKEANGQYKLLLDVPADKVSMAMNIGGFSGSYTTDDKEKGKDNNTSFGLDTTDESLVKQIKQKLEESVQLCRRGKE